MKDLFAGVIKESKFEARERKINWQLNSLPNIYGDHSLLKTVCENLISNALKFTRKRQNATIQIGSVTSDNESIFYVKDNGAGFDMDYVHKLFGVFQRLHSSEEYEGTGIGLANVHKIVTRHGGRVWAEGKINEGATFYFSIPDKQFADND
jgi:light-regulated signal transduction histidine kinase (bacteriophytochrome)